MQAFIAAHEDGMSVEKLQELIALDRLCPVMVRCGGCRFTSPAQDAPVLIKAIEAAGDYVRDVSFPIAVGEYARRWPDVTVPEAKLLAPEDLMDRPRRPVRRAPVFDETQCGGVFDGHQVLSDADPGL